MKKYLMTGIAAVTMCAAFTSCSKDMNFEQATSESAVQSKYDAAFINAFGQPAANQDWGFGINATRGVNDMEAGANKNRNLWAATDGKFKLLVPTPLTNDQKDRVRAYFQHNRYLTWEQPDMSTYFVQQVYTGGTKTTGSLSKEIYTRGNGTSVTGGQHMDYLTIGGEHVLDFNAANNVNTATDVKDNNTLTNDTKYHSDQITLMIRVTPTNVGFKVSDGSVQHIDHMALVSAKTIDDWARKQENYVNGKPIGEDVWYGKDKDGYDNSFWNRSFVGLDYEQQPASDAFTGQYVKVDEIQPGYIWDSATNTILSKSEYKTRYNTEYLLDKDGNKIPWLVSNTNEFLADPANFPSQDYYMPRKEISSGYTDQVLDIQKIYAKVADNCYPVSTKQLQEWMSNVGGRDYYYSDWIVTLAPAREIQIEEGYDGRIMAEDLTASESGDFDFNDVVFDYKLLNNGKAKIKLRAAGGTLALYIGGTISEDQTTIIGGNEVHKLFDVPINTMVNTGAGSGNKDPEPFEVDCLNDLPVNIKIWVKKGGIFYELTAHTGQPASKFHTACTTNWCDEYISISNPYPTFKNWVTDTSFSKWATTDFRAIYADQILSNNSGAIKGGY